MKAITGRGNSTEVKCVTDLRIEETKVLSLVLKMFIKISETVLNSVIIEPNV